MGKKSIYFEKLKLIFVITITLPVFLLGCEKYLDIKSFVKINNRDIPYYAKMSHLRNEIDNYLEQGDFALHHLGFTSWTI